MQQPGDECSSSPSAAELQHQEMMAIAAFCQAQKPRVQALHDNVARVYAKAGAKSDSLPVLLPTYFVVQLESFPAGPGRRSCRALRLRPAKSCRRPPRSPLLQRRGACCTVWLCVHSSDASAPSSAAGGMKRVRASAPDENMLMCNENMGDDA